MDSADRFEIQALIARFAISFDLKNWSGLESCLSESLDTDYSDLRGTPPQRVSARAYVEQRRESLARLQTHHLCGNLQIEPLGERAAHCRASMIIWRRSDAEEFTSHCLYDFHLAKLDANWRISGIKQRILWNEGTASVHPGAKQE